MYGTVEVQVLQQVTGVVGQAAAVGEQVGQGDVAADPGALEGEPRVVHRATGSSQDDGLVPDRPGDHGRGQRLGHRGELEHRVRVHRRRLAHAAYAEPPQVDDAVPVDHTERHPGHTGLGHGVVDHPVEPAERGVDLGGGEQWRRLRRRRGRERRRGTCRRRDVVAPCPDRWPRCTRRAGAPAPGGPGRPVGCAVLRRRCRGCWLIDDSLDERAAFAVTASSGRRRERCLSPEMLLGNGDPRQSPRLGRAAARARLPGCPGGGLRAR